MPDIIKVSNAPVRDNGREIEGTTWYHFLQVTYKGQEVGTSKAGPTSVLLDKSGLK